MSRKVSNGLDLQAQRIQNVGTPSAGSDAVTKDYADAVGNNRDWKQSVRVASTGNIDLATGGLLTVDGVVLAAGNRVLVKDQGTGSQNGIYVVAAGAWTRAIDADSDAEVTAGLTVSTEEGTANGDKRYVLTTNNPITVDTTALVFTVDAGGATVTAGAGLTKTGDTIDVGAGNGILADTDAVRVDPSVVARKFAVNVGDGASTSIVVTHNLASRDVAVTVYTNANPWDEVIVDVEHTDANTVTLRFATAPAANAYRAFVVG